MNNLNSQGDWKIDALTNKMVVLNEDYIDDGQGEYYFHQSSRNLSNLQK